MNKTNMNKIRLYDVWCKGAERVSKQTARQHYNNGESIIILPVNCCGEGFLLETEENYNKVVDFDLLVSEFENYNCNHGCESECEHCATYYIAATE